MGQENLVSVALACIAVPWTAWVTVSLFNQRQEIALMKQILKVVLKRSGLEAVE